MSMHPLPHHYRARLTATAQGYAQLTSEGRPPLETASPVEFGGPGDAWSPEHLLLGSVQACFLLTLRAVAAAMRIEVLRVEVEAAGTVDRQDGVMRFTEIVLQPTVTVAAGTDLERVPKLVEKTERNCLVSASLLTPVRLDTRVVVEPAGQPA